MVLAHITEFSIQLPYEITLFDRLKALCKNFEYNKETKLTKWTFHLVHLAAVAELLGKPVEFDPTEKSLMMVLERAPAPEIQVLVRRYKGQGKITVSKDPDDPLVFVVTWFQRKKPVKHKIPIETVKKLWGVVAKYDMLVEVETHLCCEHFVKALGITRFNRESGSFDFAKYFGSRRDYFVWYSCVKVLAAFGNIRHEKYGAIVRIRDELLLEYSDPPRKTGQTLEAFDENI